jgi:hypothetical protein
MNIYFNATNNPTASATSNNSPAIPTISASGAQSGSTPATIAAEDAVGVAAAAAAVANRPLVPVTSTAVSNNNMWGGGGGHVDVLDANDDFDSDQLDEDESYSWASTDNQDNVLIIGHHNPHSTGANNAGSSNTIGGGGNSIANWRDWRSNQFNFQRTALTTVKTTTRQPSTPTTASRVDKLVVLCAKYVAAHVPFELVESHREPVPEDLQLQIAYHSFPDTVDSIRMYSCLANGTADEYIRGEQLFQNRCVRRIIQIGFHLSAQVVASSTTTASAAASSVAVAGGAGRNHHTGSSSFWNSLSNPAPTVAATTTPTTTACNNNNSCVNVAIMCDRKRIVSCTCTCSRQSMVWCSHIVAVCVHRIVEPTGVEFRAPVSESLSKLDREQLQKFAQYLISELPQQVSFFLYFRY